MKKVNNILMLLVAVVCVIAAGYIGYMAFGPVGSKNGLGIGGPFTLVDGKGQAVTDKTFHGRWMLVYFGYTHCPDVCPTTLNLLAETMDDLGAKKSQVVPVFITVDPARDTPSIMQDYVSSFGPEFVGLTGTQAEIDTAEHEYRVYAAKHPLGNGDYSMDHSSIIYIMNPEGQFVGNFTDQTKAFAAAKQIATLIAGGAATS